MLLILSLVFFSIQSEGSIRGNFRSENLFIPNSDISWRDTWHWQYVKFFCL